MARITGRNLTYIAAVIITAMGLGSTHARAQEETEAQEDALPEDQAALEQIIVTAQRRLQSLQDVPLSIEAFSGEEIQKQNFRNLNDLAKFSPTVYIDADEAKQQVVLVRGIGTTGNSLHLEQAVPIFVDGVHFGRQSMAKLGFMDVARIEVLKGPQPVFFGMNAIGGAISIISRKPTPTWETDLSLELANNATTDTSFGIGGPLTETLGIRVAGKYERSDGYMWDVVRHQKGPTYENMGGRVIVQWDPTDDFRATAKVEYAELDSGGDMMHLCLIPGSLIHGRRGTLDPGDEGDEDAIWADPPKGAGTDIPITPLDTACFQSNKGIVAGGPFLEPPINIRQADANTGMLDVREVAALADPNGTLDAFEHHEVLNGYVDLQYEFDNEIAANLTVAGMDYLHDYMEDNSASPFLANTSSREEDFTQTSVELRFTSPVGETFEWMAGAFGQFQTNENFSSSFRPTVRRGWRLNELSQDSQWLNAFAAVTYNFLDDTMSLDIGGRYSTVEKDVFVNGVGAQWVYDVTPCHPDEPLPADPDNCTLGLHPEAVRITAADTSLLLDTADVTNLWTVPWRASRDAPATWRGGGPYNAVGLTLLDGSQREGPRRVIREESQFDPQVVLRYRPSSDISTFARWATAFKAGGFDTGKNSLPPEDEFEFDEETAETIELGVKGDFWDGRARFAVTAYTLSVEGLQLSTAALNPEQDTRSVNAGEQRVRGIEGNITAALTESLTLNLAGAFMDGEMTEFPNAGCSDDEFERAPESGCDPETRLIDRSGQESVRTPRYKFVLTADYWTPILNDWRLNLNAKGYVSDDYVTSLASQNRFPAHEDLNLRVAITDQDDTWRLAFFAKNLLEVRDTYDPETDEVPDGLLTSYMGQDNFTRYGVIFEYRYR